MLPKLYTARVEGNMFQHTNIISVLSRERFEVKAKAALKYCLLFKLELASLGEQQQLLSTQQNSLPFIILFHKICSHRLDQLNCRCFCSRRFQCGFEQCILVHVEITTEQNVFFFVVRDKTGKFCRQVISNPFLKKKTRRYLYYVL